MALIDTSKAQRYEIPHEPGEWVDIRPATAREMAKLNDDKLTMDEAAWMLLGWVVVDWSYGVEVSPENLDKLDIETAAWLNDKVIEASGVRDESEKKDSATASSPGPSRNGASSRKK